MSDQDKPQLDAHSSDPAVMGWMVGFPPLPEQRIRWDDAGHMRFPTHRYAFSNMREFLPSARVSRGFGPVWELPLALRDDITGLRFAPLGGGAELSWEQALAANYTDAILVLHQGKIAYERYFGATRPDSTHIVWSVTKSFVGVLAEMLVAEGKLDPATPIAGLIPELASSGFADATLRQVMDMTTALDFSEEYTDPASGIGAFSHALGLTPRPPGYSGPGDVFGFLPTIAKAGTHGERFTYRTCNTEVLGWIVARTEGKRLDQVLSERIWQPLGMEQDADWLIDSTGMPFAGGGLNPVLRDLARFGEALRCNGVGNGQQVIPVAVVESIRGGARPDDFAKAGYTQLPGWSYRSQWWITHNNRGAFTARGIHGQTIWVDPAAEMVIVRFASHPIAANTLLDDTSLPCYSALAAHLEIGG
jgi:CubicO group peptidase (beta-lactamase class C family)